VRQARERACLMSRGASLSAQFDTFVQSIRLPSKDSYKMDWPHQNSSGQADAYEQLSSHYPQRQGGTARVSSSCARSCRWHGGGQVAAPPHRGPWHPLRNAAMARKARLPLVLCAIS